MSRIAILVELDVSEDFGISDLEIIDARSYDIHDHKQVATQYFQEMALEGRYIEPNKQRVIVVGGERKVTSIIDKQSRQVEGCVKEKVPHSIWKPIPPTNLWEVVKD